MTEAIRTGSFTSGFMNGIETVDRHIDRRERRDNQREAISMQKEDREFNRTRATASDARAEESLGLQRQGAAIKQQQFQAEQKRGARRMEWEASNEKRKQREAELKDVANEFGAQAALFEKGAYDSIDPNAVIALHEKAVAARRPNLSPLSWDGETIKRVKRVGPLKQQLEQGNLEYVNSPGNLKILSELPGWSEKLNQGLGELGRNGSPIKSKELAELKMAGEGRVVPMLRVTTEDGESYIAEMSAFRSTDPNEPVVAADAGQLIDNAMAQYMIANLFDNPEAQQAISSMRAELNGRTSKPEITKVKNGDGSESLVSIDGNSATPIEIPGKSQSSGPAPEFSKVNPSQYTPESVAQYRNTGDHSLLRSAKAHESGIEKTKEATKALAQADETIKLIDSVLAHPGREAATGGSSVLNFAAKPGGERKDFLVMIDQLKGKSFLQAFESLKGAGQITEIEGLKAENAQARLDTAQSEKAFVAALNELKDVVSVAVERAQTKANDSETQSRDRKSAKLMVDSSGNRAYVWGDGHVEEAQ